MRSSIRNRLILSYVLVTLLSVGVMGGLGLSLVTQLAQLRAERELSASAEAIAEQALPWLREEPAPPVLGELAEGAAFLLDARVRILGAEAQVLAESAAARGAQELIWRSAEASRPGEVRGMLVMDEAASPISRAMLGIAEDLASPATPPAAPLVFALRREGPGIGPSRVTLEILRVDAPHEEAPASRIEIEARRNAAQRPAGEPPRTLEPGTPAATEQGILAERRVLELDPESPPGSDAIPGSEPGPSLDDPLARFLAGEHGIATVRRSSEVVRVAVGPVEQPLGFVEISGAPDPSGALVASTARAFGLAAMGAALLSALVGLVVSRSMSEPLAQLDRAAGRMGAGDLAARAPVEREDEIGRLARGFNAMAAGLEASFAALEAERDALRRFAADASHELRTPITALGNYNTLLQGLPDEEGALRRDFLAEQAGQIERLSWITRNLLDLSRLDAGLVELEREPCPAGQLWAAALAPLRGRAEAAGVALELEPAGAELELCCDPVRTVIALGNLVENALKFSPAGGRVRLRTTERAQPGGERAGLCFEVADEGPGIPEAERDRVFERFHRGAATAGQPGSGLGLAIVRAVARAHGGQAWVARGGAARGTCMRLWLPREGAGAD